jgi:hypothetical protein
MTAKISRVQSDFIEQELYHELRCLLGAATVWRIFREKAAGFDVAIAMDSAFIHARNLLIFFSSVEKSSNSIRVTDFGIEKPYKSEIYSVWKEPLNRHLFHLNKRRMKPTNLKKSGHLKDKVEIFANEVLALWQKLESDPKAESLRIKLEAARKRAIDDAANDAEGRIKPLFG